MRLVAGALALVLFAPIARAEDTTTAEPARPVRPAEDPAHSRIPLRVVRVMPESHQALLFDRARATHVLAEVGGKLEGYTVEDIDDDAVTLTRDGRQIVLSAPPRTNRRRRDAVAVRSAAARPSDTAEPAPVDPYDDAAVRAIEAPGAIPAPAASSPAPTSPGTGEAGIRVVRAPDAPAPQPVVAGEGGIRVAEAPGATPAPVAEAPTPAPSPPTTGNAAAPPPISAAPPAAASGPVTHPTLAAGASEPRAADAARTPDKPTLDARALADVMTADGRTRGPRSLTADPPAGAAAHPVTAAPMPADAHPGDAVISRGELDRALADFAGLTAALRGSFSASGVTVERVGEGTIFQRAGLRAGDVVVSVDGARLRSLDDAANLYVQASTAKAMTAQILRGGKPVTLHVVIQ